MTARRLTFELSKDGVQLEIHGNEDGLRFLVKMIENLLNKPNRQEHSHLMTEAWGGVELSSEKHIEDGKLLNMVTIYFWPND